MEVDSEPLDILFAQLHPASKLEGFSRHIERELHYSKQRKQECLGSYSHPVMATALATSSFSHVVDPQFLYELQVFSSEMDFTAAVNCLPCGIPELDAQTDGGMGVLHLRCLHAKCLVPDRKRVIPWRGRSPRLGDRAQVAIATCAVRAHFKKIHSVVLPLGDFPEICQAAVRNTKAVKGNMEAFEKVG